MSTTEATSIAWIGLGKIGAPMAMRMVEAGHHVLVHDLRAESAAPHLAAGATWAPTARAAAQEATVVFTSLPGPKEVEATILGPDGIVVGVRPGTVYVDLSTSSPTLMRRLEAVFAERDVEVLDAPVSGGVVGAENGTLQLMVGGRRATFDRLRPLLEVLGSNVSLMGDVGCGMVAKLVHNTISTTTNAILAEALTLGVKAGVRPEALLEAIVGGGYGQGLVLRHGLPERVFQGKFDDGGFTLQLSHKDVSLAMELARELDVPMPVVSRAEENMAEALRRGWGPRDSSVTYLIQEERAGVELRGSD